MDRNGLFIFLKRFHKGMPDLAPHSGWTTEVRDQVAGKLFRVAEMETATRYPHPNLIYLNLNPKPVNLEPHLPAMPCSLSSSKTGISRRLHLSPGWQVGCAADAQPCSMPCLHRRHDHPADLCHAFFFAARSCLPATLLEPQPAMSLSARIHDPAAPVQEVRWGVLN